MKYTKKPVISIIIPVYNTEPELLGQCIASIERQRIDPNLLKSRKPFEIILVDDCSAHRSTQKYLDGLAISAPDINIIRLPNNRGASAARNAGIDAAKGDYVMFVDSDDEIGVKLVNDGIAVDTGYLCKFLKNAKDYKSGLVLGELMIRKEGYMPYVTTGGYALKNEKVSDRKKTLDFLIDRISANSALYSKDLLNGLGLRFDANKIYAEDTAFVTETMLSANKVSTVVNCYYLYKKRSDSLVGLLSNHSESPMRRIKELQDRIKFFTRLFWLLGDKNKTTNGERSTLICKEIAYLNDVKNRILRNELPSDIIPLVDTLAKYVPTECIGCGRDRCDKMSKKAECRKYQGMYDKLKLAQKDLLGVGKNPYVHAKQR